MKDKTRKILGTPETSFHKRTLAYIEPLLTEMNEEDIEGKKLTLEGCEQWKHKGIWRGKRKVYYNYETNEDVFEWVEGYYVCLLGEEHLIYNGYAEKDGDTFYPDYYPVNPLTLGKCTCLTDKNGNLIFEGDILTTAKFNHPEKKYVVMYDKFSASFIAADVLSNCFIPFDGDSDMFEIIGNIHDNPELIQKGAAE